MAADLQPPRVAERRRPYRGEVRRSAILAALEDLLEQRRLADVSVADISAAAGVKRNTFYFYFPNKSAAVAALLSELFEEMFVGTTAFIGHTDDPERGIKLAIDNTVATWAKHQNLYMAILDARQSDPAVRQFWDDWLARFIGPVAEAIEAERAAGRAKPGPDATTLSTALTGMNVTLLDRIGRSGFSDESADLARKTLFHVCYHAIYG